MIKTSENKATKDLPFLGWVNENVRLETVDFNPAFVKKEDIDLPANQQVKKAVLTFKFVNNLGDTKPNEKRHFSFVKYEISQDSESFDKVIDILSQQIQHIYEVFTGQTMPLIEADTVSEFYGKIADLFNRPTVTEEATTYSPIYKGADGRFIPVNLKCTFDKQSRLTLGYPNFIERYTSPGKTFFVRNPKEKYEPTMISNPLAIDNAGAGAANDLPF